MRAKETPFPCESQTLKTMIHETAHAMLHDKDLNRDISAPAKDRNTKEVEAESVAYTVCKACMPLHFGINTSDYSFSYIAGWTTGRDMKELKSSLDLIRRTASELITGIEGQLKELQRDRELMQAQEKESILLIQNSGLSEVSLLNVRGMDAAEVMEALSSMNDDDRMNVSAYLESRGAWTAEISGDELGEKHPDVRYNTDTNEITDMRAETEPEEEIKEGVAIEDAALEKAAEEAAVEEDAAEEAGALENAAIETAVEETGGLPDPMIGIEEMHGYGYTWEEMLPLTKEKAMELFDRDLPVYMLYENGTETVSEDREQLEEHKGIFGIEKAENPASLDWENERNFRSMQSELAESAANALISVSLRIFWKLRQR